MTTKAFHNGSSNSIRPDSSRASRLHNCRNQRRRRLRLRPIHATFTRISSEAFLPRTNHSLTVVSGQAYIFGGESEPGKLAGDEIHTVSLPLKKAQNEGKPDYKVVPSLGEGNDGKLPGARAGHTACAVGERIYVLGGRGQGGKVVEEGARVWVFDTNMVGWSYVDPASDAEIPPARYLHGGAASELPFTNTNSSNKASYGEQIQSTIGKLPSLIGKGSSPQEPHGTLIICGGLSSPSSPLNDTWIFNMISRTWSSLPPTPSTSPWPPSLALAHNRLYLISSSSDLGSEIHFLPFTSDTYKDARGEGEIGLTNTKDKWSTVPFPTNPLTPSPRPAMAANTSSTSSARILPTNLRPYHLRRSIFWSDIWSYQIPAVNMTAAGTKDATRSAMGIATGEGTWAEVKIVTVVEGDQEGKSHPGPRGWFASCPVGREIKGGGVLTWGWVNGKGEVEGDGWIVNVGPK